MTTGPAHWEPLIRARYFNSPPSEMRLINPLSPNSNQNVVFCLTISLTDLLVKRTRRKNKGSDQQK